MGELTEKLEPCSCFFIYIKNAVFACSKEEIFITMNTQIS